MTNFELVSELQTLIRRDKTVADRALINPTNANPILDGEFLFVDSSDKLIRASAGSIGWVCYMERGRSDVQGIGKLTVLQGPTYEADTLVFTAASLTLGGSLQISASVSYGGQTRSGLANYASGAIIGYVTRLPANNGGKLRFMQTLF